MTDQELINDAKGLYFSCYVNECYNSKDLVRLEAIYDELEKRGYSIEEDKSINITKGDEDGN